MGDQIFKGLEFGPLIFGGLKYSILVLGSSKFGKSTFGVSDFEILAFGLSESGFWGIDKTLFVHAICTNIHVVSTWNRKVLRLRGCFDIFSVINLDYPDLFKILSVKGAQ